MTARPVEPLGWSRPKGYANGILSQGRILCIAGQIGCNPRGSKPKLARTFTAQFEQALRNVLEVLRTAGGIPTDLTRVTIYVTDKREYVAARKAIGEAWKRRIGSHYPAMTLIEVSALLENTAKVEIEATAIIQEG